MSLWRWTIPLALLGGAAVGGFWYASSVIGTSVFSDSPSSWDSASGRPSESEERAAAALTLSRNQRVVAETLVEAQRTELSSDQIAAFEQGLDALRKSPLESQTWSQLKSYETAFPLFAASENILFSCLRGRSKNPAACRPTEAYKKLLAAGVADKILSRAEADKVLELLLSLRDPAQQPALPPGGLGFLEKESKLKLANFEKIVAAVRRVEGTPSLEKGDAR